MKFNKTCFKIAQARGLDRKELLLDLGLQKSSITSLYLEVTLAPSERDSEKLVSKLDKFQSTYAKFIDSGFGTPSLFQINREPPPDVLETFFVNPSSETKEAVLIAVRVPIPA